jgi:GNAT superfamily N-acetyltransferase
MQRWIGEAVVPSRGRVEVRPIEQAELDRIPLRCWPDQRTLGRLFEEQGTIGMAVWDGERCVGQLHCYAVGMPDGTNELWTSGGNWWDANEQDQVFTDCQRWGPGLLDLPVSGPAWCHACFHVGRTLDSYRRELESGWSPDAPGVEAKYAGRGIATALCEESIRWARDHGYVAVLAPGAPDGLRAFASWAGHLPWTTYTKLGFEAVDEPDKDDEEPPGWARDPTPDVPDYLVTPPSVATDVRRALDAGRPASRLRERLMLLRITDSR